MIAVARRILSTIGAVVLAGVLTGGCDMKSPFSQQQAEQRVEARAQEALQQLPAGTSLKVGLHLTDVKCDRPAGGHFIETNYDVEPPAGWPVDQTLPTLDAYWTKQGYKVVRDERGDDTVPTLSVEDADGFRIGVVFNRSKAAAFLISSSPCI